MPNFAPDRLLTDEYERLRQAYWQAQTLDPRLETWSASEQVIPRQKRFGGFECQIEVEVLQSLRADLL